MTLEENKAVCNRAAELISQQNIAGLAEVLASPALEEFQNSLPVIFAAFPDYHGENVVQVAEGNRVANIIAYKGTHKGEFFGVPATGKLVTFNGMTVDTFVDGKIVESRVSIDLFSVLQQIGATTIPPA